MMYLNCIYDEIFYVKYLEVMKFEKLVKNKQFDYIRSWIFFHKFNINIFFNISCLQLVNWENCFSDTQSSTGEEIDFNRMATEPSEMSSLTAFAKKASAD